MPNNGTRNGGIFKNGINLLILKSPDDDITNKIEVVCPSNHYGNEYFNNKREILILYTRYGKYEPVYRYTRKTEDHKYIVTKTFHLAKINEQAPQIGRMISKIRYKLIEDCKIYHLPNNYVGDQDPNCATIKFNECIKETIFQ